MRSQIVMSNGWLVRWAVAADPSPWPRLVADERPDGVEDGRELLVIALFECVEATHKVGSSGDHVPDADEGAHDLDADLDRARVAEDA